jgi:hypothetical protein
MHAFRCGKQQALLHPTGKKGSLESVPVDMMPEAARADQRSERGISVVIARCNCFLLGRQMIRLVRKEGLI